MHLQFILRGINTQVELWKILAQGQFYKWKRLNMDTQKKEEILCQGSLRPSVLGTWEFIFPREALPEVLSTMGATLENGGTGGNISLKELRMATLRAICGVKKITKKIFREADKTPHSIVLTDSQRGLSNLIISGVAVHIIGIKDDKDGEMTDPSTGKTYFQEFL